MLKSIKSANNIPAAPPPDTECKLDLKWTKNWRDGGYHRYQARWTLTLNDQEAFQRDDPWQLWCVTWKMSGNQINEANQQCWSDADVNRDQNVISGLQDTSSFIGSNGHNIYKAGTEEAARKFQEHYGCTVSYDL